MRQRRKIITRVITFLLLGAIVNVAVAWTICYVTKWEEAGAPRCGNIPTASVECLTFIITSERFAERAEWFAVSRGRTSKGQRHHAPAAGLVLGPFGAGIPEAKCSGSSSEQSLV